MEQSRRRRKKNVYVEYDYEEAYQKQIENLEEDIIKVLPAQAGVILIGLDTPSPT